MKNIEEIIRNNRDLFRGMNHRQDISSILRKLRIHAGRVPVKKHSLPNKPLLVTFHPMDVEHSSGPTGTG